MPNTCLTHSYTVLFFERLGPRKLKNAEQLCKSLRAVGLRAALLVETLHLCSEVRALNWAQVIIAMNGGHLFKAALVRRGTLVIVVNPYNTWRSTYRLALSLAQVQVQDYFVLELQHTDARFQLQHANSSAGASATASAKAWHQWGLCVYNFQCSEWYKKKERESQKKNKKGKAAPAGEKALSRQANRPSCCPVALLKKKKGRSLI